MLGRVASEVDENSRPGMNDSYKMPSLFFAWTWEAKTHVCLLKYLFSFPFFQVRPKKKTSLPAASGGNAYFVWDL